MVLKKAYIRDLINSSVINFIFKFCNFKNDGKIIVKSMDGIGDILVRSKLADKIIEKYGHENVYFLMKDHYKNLGIMLGYNVIGISRKEEKNFFKRLKKFYEINKLYKPSIFINLDLGLTSMISNIKSIEKIGNYDENETVKYYNKFYTKVIRLDQSSKKIMDILEEFSQKILEIKLNKEEIVPNLSSKFVKKENGIVVAVGSTAREKVCSPKRMKNYLLEVIKYFPKEEIILVGNGELQKKYAEELVNDLSHLKIKNMVDKTTLEEAFNIVANSKLFIGFDSGLYNFCFVTRKKGIALFKNLNVPFAHNVSWLKIVGPSEEKIDDFYDENYPNEKINNISVEDFKKAVEELV